MCGYLPVRLLHPPWCFVQARKVQFCLYSSERRARTVNRKWQLVALVVLCFASFRVSFAAPSITGLSPTSGAVGTTVGITGTGFGSAQGTGTVTFNGTSATPTNWSDTYIAASVPSGATSGNVVVTVSGVPSNGASFTVTVPPSITSVSPTSAAAGTAMTITGTNFGSTQGTSTVTFSGIAATPTSWSDTSIVAPAPSGAGTGGVVVTVGGMPSNGFLMGISTIAPMIVTQGYDPNLYRISFTMRAVAIAQDGFARYAVDGTDENTWADDIYLVRCLDGYCTNYNATLAATDSGRPSGASLAIGNDGFPRIVYVTTDAVLHFIRCTDADCAGSVQNTPLLSPGGACNTGPPNWDPLSGVYCSSGDVNEVVIGSNGLPLILFDWQNDYYQNISLSVASCGDDACASASVSEVTEVSPQDVIAGSMVVGPDGYERIVYVDQCTSAYPQSGVAHYYVQGNSDTIIGNASSAYSADVAVALDGSGSVVLEDPSESQMELIRCNGSGCSSQAIPVQFSGSYSTFYLGVQGDGTPVVSPVGGENVDYVVCATTDCSSYYLEQMPPAVTGGSIGMAMGLDGLPRFVAGDNFSPFPYDYVTPQTNLNCSSPVARGSATICKITGAAGTSVSGWTFQDNNGNPPVNRGSNTTNTTWSGTMVTSGAVSVTVAGISSPLSASITVIARNWHLAPATPADVPNGTFYTLQVPPQPGGEDSGLGRYSEVVGNSCGNGNCASTFISDGGPNDGYGYYATGSQSFTTTYQFEINPDLTNTGSTFYSKQCGNYNSQTNPGGFILGSTLLTQTGRHEYNSNTQSHYAFYSKSLFGTNNPGDYVESRMATPGTSPATFDNETGTTLNNPLNSCTGTGLYQKICQDSEVEPYAVNQDESGSFLGNINYAPYKTCN